MTALAKVRDLGITGTDLFCGAGGTSIGAARAGVRLMMGANHNPLAIETHNTNFPHADHDCADVSQTDPRRYPTTTILYASPECTNHSQAKTGKVYDRHANLFDEDRMTPADQQRSRATMWDVIRFVEAHRYEAIIVENVVDAYWWGLEGPGYPRGDGGLFRAWRSAIEALGYESEIVWLNSMFVPPTPQSRDRMYVVYWRRGMTKPNLKIEPVSWCKHCEAMVDGQQAWKNPAKPKWGRYAEQYIYQCPTCWKTVIPGAVPAATAIDWTDLGTPIGGRKKRLAKNTRTRIRNGLERTGASRFADRLEVVRNRPGTLPIVPASMLGAAAITVPVAGNTFETTKGNRARDTAVTAMPTVHKTHELALIIPPAASGTALDAPADPNRTQTTTTRGTLVYANRKNCFPRRADESAAGTVCAGAEHLGLVVANYSPGWVRKAGEQPLGSMTTKDNHALLVPYYQTGVASPADEPVPTCTTRDRFALLVPDTAAEADDLEHVEWDDAAIDRCLYRMFQTREIATTMQMHEHHEGGEYVVLGNRTQQMAQLGNAVTPPVAELLTRRVVESLVA